MTDLSFFIFLFARVHIPWSALMVAGVRLFSVIISCSILLFLDFACSQVSLEIFNFALKSPASTTLHSSFRFDGWGLYRFPLLFPLFHFLGVRRRHPLLCFLVGIQSWSIWIPVACGLLGCCFLLCSWLSFQILGCLHLLLCCWFYISLSICIPWVKFGHLFSFLFHWWGQCLFSQYEVRILGFLFCLWFLWHWLWLLWVLCFSYTLGFFVFSLPSMFAWCLGSVLFLQWLVYCLVCYLGVSILGCCGWLVSSSAGRGACILDFGVGCTLVGGVCHTMADGAGCTLAGAVDCTLTVGVGCSLAGGVCFPLAGGFGFTLAGGVACTLTVGVGCTLAGGVGCTLADGVGCTLAGGVCCHLAVGAGCTWVGGVDCPFAGGLGCSLAGGVTWTLAGGVACTLAGGVDCPLAGGVGCTLAAVVGCTQLVG